MVWYCLSFHGFVGFHSLHKEFLEESFIVVALWSYAVLVSAYYGRLLLFHLFWMIVLLGRVSWGWSYFHSVPGRAHSMLFLFLKVSVEKSTVILMGLSLCVICFFSLTAFNILSLYSVLFVSMIICHGVVLFWSSLLGVMEASCTLMGIVFFWFGKFYVIILLNILQIHFACTSSPS
jgi:hypothetical protein